MIIVCPQCQKQYRCNEDFGDKERFSVRCTGCGTVFGVAKPNNGPEIQFCNLSEAKKSTDDRKIIAVSNQKGGVAKTSTCLNLGMSLAQLGRKVLLIDFDVQANLSICMGFQNKISFYDAMSDSYAALSKYILPTAYRGLWLLPSNKNMVLLNKKYFGVHNFEYLLKDRLATIRGKFDHIIIDTPPSIEFLTMNALTAAGLAVIPSQCDYLSVHGVDQVFKVIELIESRINPTLKAKVLITMFDRSSTASKLIFGKLRDRYGKNAFKTIIEWDNKVKEAQIMNVPVLQYDRQSKAGLQYTDLAKEVLQHCLAAA